MFQFLRQPQTIFLSIAAAFALAPVAGAAAPVTLRYDFTAIVTSTSYFHECYFDFPTCADYEADGYATTYQGPTPGDGGTGWLTASFDTADAVGSPARFTYSLLGLAAVTSGQTISTFDAGGSSVGLSAFNGFDLFEILVGPAGGSGYFGYEQDLSGVDFAEAEFRLFDVAVTDLTARNLAPAPLPAALPMLAAGLAGLGALRRRSRT